MEVLASFVAIVQASSGLWFCSLPFTLRPRVAVHPVKRIIADSYLFLFGMLIFWWTMNISNEPYKDGKFHICLAAKRNVSGSFVEWQSFLFGLMIFLFFLMVGRGLYKMYKSL